MDYGGGYGGSSQSPSRFGGFGGGGGPQGGGFLASPSAGGGGGGSFMSPGGAQGGVGPANRTLVPVTARQIVNCQEPQGQSGVLIDGAEAGQVKVVARVMRVDPQATFVEVHVHDGTAPLEVRKWVERNDAGDIAGDMEVKFREGQYVKLVGKLKYFQNQCTVQTHAIVPITDYNEVTYHLLEAMYVHEMRKNMEKQQGMAPQSQQFQQQSNFGQQNVPMNTAPQQHFDASAGGGNDALTPLQSQILQFFRQDNSEAGADVQSVVAALAGQPGADLNQIRQDIDFLSTEGHVYSTIDEEHFKCT